MAGDWHGNVSHVASIIPAITREFPETRTVLHVGDFGIWPERGSGFLGTVSYWAKSAGIQRVLVTPGNYEYYPRINDALASHPGAAVQLNDVIGCCHGVTVSPSPADRS